MLFLSKCRKCLPIIIIISFVLILCKSMAINNQEINFLIKSFKVDISLQDNVSEQYLTPEQVLDYKLKVVNKGLPCLIRFKVLPDNIKIIDDNYTYLNGYYYSDYLGVDDSKLLISGLQVDEDLLQLKQNQMLDFKVIVEAIQYEENIDWNQVEVQEFQVE